jgi:hypothetical protein
MPRLPSVLGFLAAFSTVAAAQTGNLVTSGQFDTAADLAPWTVISPAYSSHSFDSGEDADLCSLSGSLDALSDPEVDFGVAQYRHCLGPVSGTPQFWIAGDFKFPVTSAEARANLTLNFYTGSGCSGEFAGGTFAGYATSDVAGWQHVEAGPVSPGGNAVSFSISVLLTQITGSDPAVEVLADNVRVTQPSWVFAEDLEVADVCRWSASQP